MAIYVIEHDYATKHGPFATVQEACDWARDNFDHDNWWWDSNPELGQ